MRIPTLDIDILLYIMAFSTRKTLLEMMLTSRALHRGGIKHLLKHVPSIWSMKKFKSFLYFCDARGKVAHTSYRMNYLRGLKMDLQLDFHYDEDKGEIRRKLRPISQAFAHFLTSTVRIYAHNFTRLFLLKCDDLLAADPNLSLAIASLTTLTHLTLGELTEYEFKLLGSLRSHLVEANLSMNAEFINERSDGDLTAFLRHSESSMTILSLCNTSNLTGVACYPQLHTLDIRHLDLPTTRPYVTTFPNLQVFRASECTAGFYEPDEQEEWTQCRNFNISQQARDGSWRSLRAYIGSILCLYLFGLGCHVTYLRLHADSMYEVMDFRRIRMVVADTRPEHLVVNIWTVSQALDQAESIIALFNDRAFRAVKTCILDFSFHNTDHITDAQAMFECVFAAVASNSSLSGFGFVVKWSDKYRFMEDLDVHSVADSLLRSCPSLQAVKVTIGKVTVERGPTDIFFDEETLGPGPSCPGY